MQVSISLSPSHSTTHSLAPHHLRFSLYQFLSSLSFRTGSHACIAPQPASTLVCRRRAHRRKLYAGVEREQQGCSGATKTAPRGVEGSRVKVKDEGGARSRLPATKNNRQTHYWRRCSHSSAQELHDRPTAPSTHTPAACIADKNAPRHSAPNHVFRNRAG